MEEQIIILQPQQILLPKKVYIGDSAELRCTFNSSDSVLGKLTQNGITTVSVDSFLEPLDSRDFEIIDVRMAPAGVNYYQISITFKAWKTGDVRFPSMRIGNTQINFAPVNIVSISEQEHALVLKDSAAPLLMPGTTYKLYGALFLFVVVLFTAIRLIVKRKSVMLYIHNKRLMRLYKKNKRQTIKKLSQLKKAEIDDYLAAEEIQHLMRNYLEVRFSYPFTKTVTSDFIKSFYTATNNVFTEKKETAVTEIAGLFVRLDYIRYSKKTGFEAEEKQSLIIKMIEMIEQIEMPGGEEDNA